jgi:hypothetical protein
MEGSGLATGRIMRLTLSLLLLFAAACGAPDSRSANGDTTRTDSTARPGATSGATPVTPALSVTELGIGGLRAGMTVAEARTALGGAFPAPANTECDFTRSTNLPTGVKVMVVNGFVARVDVDSGSVPTADGARVGDTQQRVLQIYGSRAKVGPHKYTDGNYLVVKPASGDTTHLIVFETDGKVVTRYRAGRAEQAQWVEGCS